MTIYTICDVGFASFLVWIVSLFLFAGLFFSLMNSFKFDMYFFVIQLATTKKYIKAVISVTQVFKMLQEIIPLFTRYVAKLTLCEFFLFGDE